MRVKDSNTGRTFSSRSSFARNRANALLLAPRSSSLIPARRGLSLTEVLISFFILLVGVVSIIALFPVGVLSVQEAVKDTRSTITALEAQALVLGMGWPDDRYLIAPPHTGFNGAPGYGASPAITAGQSPTGGDPRGVDQNTNPAFAGTRPANDAYPSGGSAVFAPGVNNVYATVPNANGTVPKFPTSSIDNVDVGQRFHPMAGAGIGFPVYVDPQMANAAGFQYDPNTPMTAPRYKRVQISKGPPSDPASSYTWGESYPSISPFIGNLNDLVIHSLSEVQYQQAGTTALGLASPSQRDQFIRQHFFVQDEIHTEWNLPSAPYNPNRAQATPLPGWRYVKSADSASPTAPGSLQPPAFNANAASVNQTYQTASRNANYTWSFVIRNRNLQTQPANGPQQPQSPTGTGAATPPGLDCPSPPPVNSPHPYLVPKPNDFSNDNITVLVFHKRPISCGYELVRGCVFNGSAAMTISWDPAVTTEAPPIRRGTWLMEATLSPGLRDTTPGPPSTQRGPAPMPETSILMGAYPPATPASGYVKYRHAVEFYRVASVEEAVPSQTGDGQMYQVVNLEQPVTSFPISHVLGDGRALPDLLDQNNPGSPAPVTFDGLHAYPNYLPGRPLVPSGGSPYATQANQEVHAVWVPIVVWHGLHEVYSVRN